MSSALSPTLESLSASPIIQFPKEAEAGKTYLFTIDLSPRQAFETWPYHDREEVIVYCLINAAPLFSIEPLGEPAVVIHRFGGTYGPARFLITAATEPQEGIIRITLVNALGVPMTTLETPVISVRTKVEITQPADLRVGPRERKTVVPPADAPKVFVPEVSPSHVPTSEVYERPPKLFISSTYRDVEEYLLAVYNVLSSINDKVIVLLDQFSSPTSPHDDDAFIAVDSCDIFIGIFGWRYGYVPERDNPDQMSVTEIQYRRARARNIPCLIFLVSDKVSWPRAKVETGSGAVKMANLRRMLTSELIVSYFETVDDLAAKVLAAVYRLLLQKDIIWSGSTLKVEATPSLSIPDNKTAGVTHGLSVTNDDGRITRLTCMVEIAHTYIGDLRVSLTCPTGKTIVLHDRTGGSAGNLVTTYRSEDFPALAVLVGEQAKGEWKLQVADLSSGDVGELRYWGLEMVIEATTQTIQPESTPESATPTVPGLELPPSNISISRLPVTDGHFLGREAELKMLDDAWASKTNVVSLIAWGGAGKSALVNQWLARMAEANFRGAERVYGWSFYEQYTTDSAVSADQFITSALKWFGDSAPNSPWDKGDRLTRLVNSRRTLLVLDGLDQLQFPPGPDEGRVKDPALFALLRGLAVHSQGLCLITSRAAVGELSSFEGATALQINLESLSSVAGAELLRAQGVTGTEEELQQASIEFVGHPLSLAVLGRYLRESRAGDIRRRHELSSLEEDHPSTLPVQSIMASYERWLGKGPELAALRLVCLFQGSASEAALAALRATPAISGLTDDLSNLNEQRWQQTVAVLRRAGLIMVRKGEKGEALTTHPLVRMHFVKQLRRTRLDAWRKGHKRLYEHFSRSTKEFPETLEEMAPLYIAIYHGCQAGRAEEVIEEVYRKRIHRGNELFSLAKLGAFASELAALSNFVEERWTILIEGLSESSRHFILGTTGYVLLSLGRWAESVEPLKASLDLSVAQEDWDNASIAADNLAMLYLTVGEIANALPLANQAFEAADKTDNKQRSFRARATLGQIQHQAGRMLEAEAAFRMAEIMQKEWQPQFPLLFSVQGFAYGELLLDLEKYKLVKDRAAKTLELARGTGNILDTALSLLSMSRASLRSEKTGQRPRTVVQLRQVVNDLRRAGQTAFLPYGLLTRAELHRVRGEFEPARQDLDEVMSIAGGASMKLHEADCHLELARLFLAMSKRDSARDMASESLDRARQLIESTGYHRRDKDVSEIEEQLNAKRQKPAPVSTQTRDKVFISYSHADKKWVDRLMTFLAPVVSARVVTLWDDTVIKPGEKWKERFHKEVASAKVALLLVSANFLASHLITDREISPLLQAAEKDGLKLLCVALSPSAIRHTWLQKFQMINDPSKPLNTLTRAKRDRELTGIAEAVHTALNLSQDP